MPEKTPNTPSTSARTHTVHWVGPRTICSTCGPPWLLTTAHNIGLRLSVHESCPRHRESACDEHFAPKESLMIMHGHRAQTGSARSVCKTYTFLPRWDGRRQNAQPVITAGTADSPRAALAAELGHQAGLHVARRSCQAPTSTMRAVLTKTLRSDGGRKRSDVRAEGWPPT